MVVVVEWFRNGRVWPSNMSEMASVGLIALREHCRGLSRFVGNCLGGKRLASGWSLLVKHRGDEEEKKLAGAPSFSSARKCWVT